MAKIEGKRTYRMLPDSGEYGQHENGNWYCCPPNTDLIGNITAHNITEHEDGTITVSPSILIKRYDGKQWHGYLERGVWREV